MHNPCTYGKRKSTHMQWNTAAAIHPCLNTDGRSFGKAGPRQPSQFDQTHSWKQHMANAIHSVSKHSSCHSGHSCHSNAGLSSGAHAIVIVVVWVIAVVERIIEVIASSGLLSLGVRSLIRVGQGRIGVSLQVVSWCIPYPVRPGWTFPKSGWRQRWMQNPTRGSAKCPRSCLPCHRP